MRRIFFVLCVVASQLNAQKDSSVAVELDLLKSPSSPGFILLNQQPTDIERPISPTDFAVSIRNSTENFSGLPKNYAVEMAPAWLFCPDKIKYVDAFGKDSHSDLVKNVWQTLSLSMAYAPIDSGVPTSGSQFGFGLKFSLLRGKINPEFTKLVDSLTKSLQSIGIDFTSAAEKVLEKDKEYLSLIEQRAKIMAKPEQTDLEVELIGLLSEMIARVINQKKNELIAEYKNENIEKVKNYTKNLGNIENIRTGGFLDFSAGMVLDFPSQVFDYSEINKYGAWLTGGVDNKNWSFMLLGRMLYNQKTLYKNDTNFVKSEATTNLDGGLRILYKKNKFSTSVEGIYRNYLGNSAVINGFKGTFYLSYDIGNNKLLTLNVTRDFDGTLTKKGNLVTAMNLIIGFGGNRSIK